MASPLSKAACLLFLVACGGTAPSSAGKADSGASGSDGGGAGGAEAGDEVGNDAVLDGMPPEASPSDPLPGTWVGAIENFTTGDGTGALTLTVRSGPLGGQVTFGSSLPPPPATDPDVGYPPGFHVGYGSNVLGVSAVIQPYPGFPYSLVNPTFDGQQLRFDVVLAELWKGWCGLQTPLADATDAGVKYFCEHDWAVTQQASGCSQLDPQSMQQVPIDCEKVALCGLTAGICSCTAQACSDYPYASIHVVLTVAAAAADGTVGGLDSSLHKTHLIKM
jgi:hypothetical protein